MRLRGALRPKVMEAVEVLHGLYDDLYAGVDDGSTSGGTTAGEAGAGEPEAGGPTGEPAMGSEAEPRQEFDPASGAEQPPAPRPRHFGWFPGRGPAWRRPLGA